ncbi:tRNA-adenosine deaminase [Limosilactobacillus frumenti DSM 13145]|uniref:tRNA-specific adenosine deaminase n=1 Tax=Limosilactobacillus frumenti DSM 13145 TaxID=1423746 RepID=A0A0R1PDY4_9LACO|nr:tRNA adenosine(34) deaminase TadA [Limosilactobacillus frumenti]KRL28370.1 tRNA-adenosine deaminase [Limosilactobacillus frumenti DSM 13145]MBA2913765.1 nucleoside deaminase [Limosilactobacillus frumenti]QFG72163.1 nucleoside deaminase [Limosilactobacillus frumenti]
MANLSSTAETPQQIKFMEVAINEAEQAAILGEVPIGAVVVKDGQIIGRGHNMREKFQDATYHAEVLAIMEACQNLHSWRLEDCDLYVTLEPCIMCSGAIINSRIRTVYYGAADPKAGAVDSLYHLLNDQRLNHQVNVMSGVLGKQCSQMLKEFFRAIRKKRKLARKKKAGN